MKLLRIEQITFDVFLFLTVIPLLSFSVSIVRFWKQNLSNLEIMALSYESIENGLNDIA